MLSSDSRENAGPSGQENDSVASVTKKQCDPIKTQIGIYGWRKRCLFVLILVLIFIVVFNLCLTLWFMEVMQFSSLDVQLIVRFSDASGYLRKKNWKISENEGVFLFGTACDGKKCSKFFNDGMGTLKILKGGMMLNGRAYFMDKMVASSISSREGKPLSFLSSQNLSVSVKNSKGREVSNFQLNKNSVSVTAPSFNITGTRGETLFSASKERIIFGSGEVRFTGMTGAVFDGSIQTPLIRGHYKRDLQIESVTRMLEIFGPDGIVIDSRAGDIRLTYLTNLKFETTAGIIKIDGSRLYLPRLKEAFPAKEPNRLDKNTSRTTIYQVCICTTGRLYLSPSDGECIPIDECQ